MDEGGYWGAWNEQALRDTWARYAAALAALSDPAALQQFLEEAGLNMEVTAPPEIGKRLSVAQPLWRQDWGISAGEN
jgi:hypothetical protein